jgi:hypothetical protein
MKRKHIEIKFENEKMFERFLKLVGREVEADGLDLNLCAGEVADSLYHNPDIKNYMDKNHPEIKTTLQWREFIAGKL